MNRPNRDLLVLFDQGSMTPQAIEHEVELLHELLCAVEDLDSLVVAHEAIDLNKYKLISRAVPLKMILKEKVPRSFVFLNCKN